ncbi:transcriptional regulator [Halobacteriales archaeon SW_12_69_24]|jgi:predicted DNA binding protein|nr:MAG: transcriptional regulator [Halobacteriales archaeon SW_12_69_24]
MIDDCLMVEFRIEGDDCPLAATTREVAVTVAAEPPLLRGDGNVLLRFSAPPDPDLAAVLDADDRIRYLYRARTEDRDTYRCLSRHPCVVHQLVDTGFVVESLTYSDGGVVLQGAVVGYDVLETVLETAGRTVGITLERVYALRPDEDAPVETRWDLTPAQTESLREALAMGYFGVPRAATASEVADALAISKTAFLERLRRAQASVFAAMFPGIDARRDG